jgi:UDPglucose 6-dehydrogenase
MRVHVYGDTLCAQVTAISMAQTGHQVTWAVPEGMAWDALNRGHALYREGALPELLESEREAGRLVCKPSSDVHPDADVVFLALQPGRLDIARELLAREGIDQVRLVVNQGAGPVGSTESLQGFVSDLGASAEVCALPDLVQEGNALDSFVRPESILLGCKDVASENMVRELLRPFNRRQDVIRVMSPREAEFARLAITGILATRLSFMNDMAELAEDLSVDIDIVRMAMGADPRVGDAYLYPGCGFGGPGLSRGVMTLIDALHAGHSRAGLLDQVLQINERQKEVLFRKLWQHYKGDIAGKRVALWGASFKPGTHRVENGPALALVQALAAQDVLIAVHDPMALEQLRAWSGDRFQLELCEDPYAAAEGADALMLVTEWKLYWSPDWDRLKSLMSQPFMLDGRNIYNPDFVRSKGFVYSGVGRG